MSPGDSVKLTSEVAVEDTSVLLALWGPRNERLKILEREGGVGVGLRGNRIFLEGQAENVALAERFLAETAGLLKQGVSIANSDIARAVRMLRAEPHVRL